MSTISASTTSTTAYKVTADTTGTLVLQTGSTPTTAVTVGTDQSVTLAGTLAVQSQNISPYTGFKNRIINGAMVIDQRNAGASVTPTASSTYTLDRWAYVADVASKASVQQSSTAPAGFVKSLLVTSLGAYTPASGEEFRLNQAVEGLNINDLNWGTANAVPVTLSFWVRSSITGSYSAYLANVSYGRVYVSAYTINAANTWEYKTITIPGCTDGTWSTTNTTGIALGFELAAGSAYYATNNTWNTSSAARCTSSQTNFVGTNGATFYITGVQLEKGSTATSFDYRPYGTELALCQRYFESSNAEGVLAYIPFACYTVSDLYGTWFYRVTKRTTPTVTILQTGWNAYSNGGTKTIYSVTNDGIGVNNVCIDIIGTGWTAGNSAFARNTSTNAILISAEL